VKVGSLKRDRQTRGCGGGLVRYRLGRTRRGNLLVGAARIFLHPEISAYDKSHENEALEWIVG
jgi:hypothetical protein